MKDQGNALIRMTSTHIEALKERIRICLKMYFIIDFFMEYIAHVR